MCDELGESPDNPPIEIQDLPPLVQTALEIYSYLPDDFDGMSGTYKGKNYSLVPFLCNEVYKIKEKYWLMYFIRIISEISKKEINDKLERQRKASKNKKR